MKQRKIIFGIIWAVWVAVMFFFLEQPGDQSSIVSGIVTQFILRVMNFLRMDPAELEHVIRKLAHFGAFTGSGFLGTLTLRPMKYALPLSALIHAALAALSEYLQTLAPDRCCSITDIGIDFAGACLGIALACALFVLLRRRSEK